MCGLASQGHSSQIIPLQVVKHSVECASRARTTAEHANARRRVGNCDCNARGQREVMPCIAGHLRSTNARCTVHCNQDRWSDLPLLHAGWSCVSFSNMALRLEPGHLRSTLHLDGKMGGRPLGTRRASARLPAHRSLPCCRLM